jgi:hypothetical protein
MELPLRAWLDTIIAIVNAQTTANHVATLLRKRLTQLIAGDLPMRLKLRRHLPQLGVSVSRNVVELHHYRGEDVDPRREPVHRDKGYELEGVIYVLSADPLRNLVRRCDHCDKFFVAARNHRRKHHFCCTAHRRAFDHAHRDPKKQAAYMRKYRDVVARMREKTR